MVSVPGFYMTKKTSSRQHVNAPGGEEFQQKQSVKHNRVQAQTPVRNDQPDSHSLIDHSHERKAIPDLVTHVSVTAYSVNPVSPSQLHLIPKPMETLDHQPCASLTHTVIGVTHNDITEAASKEFITQPHIGMAIPIR